ncbi:FxsB family cyclophane-forming radical SAM/SPASM peptide maturase [Nonomuraea sp. NPDC000554]|uniref:FxsB family cyclophane-forming radical SAM/SPASM peptide maturase n=1 Tax=Nonomuraea sp. NPDC000554 TaxID=3154259 RepID=UPI00332938D7
MPEWPSTLDVDALLAGGWQPTPLRQFVLKVHSRCDLACSYCYVYEMADQSWRSRPKRMSRVTAEAAAARIAEHARTHGLPGVQVVLHGGEPLLAGAGELGAIVELIRSAVAVPVDVVVQTNATLLDDTFLRLFARLGVGVGVSLDGARHAHDRARRTADGRGSYAKVAAALERLTAPAYRHLFRGLLCTVDLRNDPLETYEALLAFSPPTVDFLLPHGNWAAPPPGREAGAEGTPYADWLIAIFDRWYATDPRPAGVRLFDEIIHLLLGGSSASEQVGLSPVAMAVIETDGEIEQSDILKSAFDGAGRTGLHVTHDSFDELLHLPSTAARQIGPLALAPTCTVCPVGMICGGGQYAHRYRPATGFRNPSVYCPDLLRLIRHIGSAVQADLAVRVKEPAMNLTEHRVPADVFAALATGGGGAQAVERLVAAERSKHLLLVRGVLDAAHRADHPRWAEVRRAYDLLATIESRHPEAVDTVVRHPSVGAWARHAVRTLEAPEQLAALAAAAAIRAGFTCEVDVPVADGVITLPSLGQITLPATVSTATVHCSGDAVEVSANGIFLQVSDVLASELPGWQGLRSLTAEAGGLRFGVLIDDLDPHRMPGSANLRGRLTREEAAVWQGLLDEAWGMLVANHGTVAQEVAAAIRVLTPLAAPPQGLSSATSRETFGCIALSTPPDAHEMAVTLTHETQHAKLSALLDIVPLTRPDDGSRYYAPWRDDPRPVPGLLQGAYAYLGVTDFWRRQRHHEDGAALIRASSEFARWREAARMVSGTILGSGGLTEPGEVFVGRMIEQLDAWAGEPVPDEATAMARQAAERHHALWQARNNRSAADLS